MLHESVYKGSPERVRMEAGFTGLRKDPRFVVSRSESAISPSQLLELADSSGGMRICGMIRRSLLLENESELRLLPATPRRWLEPGKKIVVLDAVTYFGNLNLRVKSRVNQGNIVVELVLRKDRPDRLRNIPLRLPHPDRQRMKQVTVNGTPWKNFDAEQEAIELKPIENRYQILVQY